MKKALEIYQKQLTEIANSGTYKKERIITTEQSAIIDTTEVKQVLNMCANNY